MRIYVSNDRVPVHLITGSHLSSIGLRPGGPAVANLRLPGRPVVPLYTRAHARQKNSAVTLGDDAQAIQASLTYFREDLQKGYRILSVQQGPGMGIAILDEQGRTCGYLKGGNNLASYAELAGHVMGKTVVAFDAGVAETNLHARYTSRMVSGGQVWLYALEQVSWWCAGSTFRALCAPQPRNVSLGTARQVLHLPTTPDDVLGEAQSCWHLLQRLLYT